jgi:spore germination protein YaaH
MPANASTSTPYRQPEVTVWALQATYPEKKVLKEYSSLIREVNFVWYFLGGNNRVSGKNPNPAYVKELQSLGIRVVPAIQNTGFVPSHIHTMVSDPANRAKHINELVEIVSSEGYDGIDIDYESMNLEDKDDYSLFIEELAAALHAEKKLLSVTVHPKTSDDAAWESARGQDWARLGAAADMFKIMVYDYSSGPGESGPVAPLDWAKQVIDYAIGKVHPEKIYLGLPFYGYDYAAGTKKSLTWMGTQALITRYSATVQRDDSNEAWFTYESGGVHTVYFNDALATETKVKAIWETHPSLAGVSIWVLGGEDPNNWSVLSKLFIR